MPMLTFCAGILIGLLLASVSASMRAAIPERSQTAPRIPSVAQQLAQRIDKTHGAGTWAALSPETRQQIQAQAS